MITILFESIRRELLLITIGVVLAVALNAPVQTSCERRPQACDPVNWFDALVHGESVLSFAPPVLADGTMYEGGYDVEKGTIEFKWDNLSSPVFARMQSPPSKDKILAASSPVQASADGIVARVWESDAPYEYGREGNISSFYVLVRHDNGYETEYGDLEKVAVHLGQRVIRQQAIGFPSCFSEDPVCTMTFKLLQDGEAVDLSAAIPCMFRSTSEFRHTVGTFFRRDFEAACMSETGLLVRPKPY